MSEKFRKFSAAEILKNMEDVSPVVRVKVAQDMLPGGLGGRSFDLLTQRCNKPKSQKNAL